MRTRSLVLAAVLVAGLIGCSESGPETTAQERPSSSDSMSASATEAAVATTPLEGSWRLEQTQRDIVKHLKEYGFGDLVDRFLRVEGVTPQDVWEWEFTGKDYVARWQNPDGSWKVADWGRFEVSGDRVFFFWDTSGNKTTFAWRVEGDRLWLDWLAYRGTMYKGLPDEAYWRAYLTKPLTRVS